jgi:glutamyl-tRNA synthetase
MTNISNTDQRPVVTRFAPSPTGFMHVGGTRTALYAYLFARKHDGKFILRIEDTDKEREVTGAAIHIQESLRYILQKSDFKTSGSSSVYFPGKSDIQNISNNPWDELYVQSERLDIYISWAKVLVERGLAYFDPYTKEELEDFRQAAQNNKKPFLYRDHRPTELDTDWSANVSVQGGMQSLLRPLRFKIDDAKRTDWVDAVRGNLSAGPEALDDFIIFKTDGYPTYNFCHIIDDIEMRVSHVMRGEEFIPSTPKFIALYEALQKLQAEYGEFPGADLRLPIFATLPPILGETGTKKLSKRDGAKDVLDYHVEGFLPVALANFLAFQGWNPGGERELYSYDDLIANFSIDRIQKSGARWNPEKLDWFNKEHMKMLYVNESHPNGNQLLQLAFYTALPDIIKDDPRYQRQSYTNIGADDGFTLAFQALFGRYFERVSYFGELGQEPILFELQQLIEPITISSELILADLDRESTVAILEHICTLLTNSDESSWSESYLRELLQTVMTQYGTKAVLWPLRTALSGQKKSIDPFSLLRILGKDESIARTMQATAVLRA